MRGADSASARASISPARTGSRGRAGDRGEGHQRLMCDSGASGSARGISRPHWATRKVRPVQVLPVPVQPTQDPFPRNRLACPGSASSDIRKGTSRPRSCLTEAFPVGPLLAQRSTRWPSDDACSQADEDPALGSSEPHTPCLAKPWPCQQRAGKPAHWEDSGHLLTRPGHPGASMSPLSLP